MVVLPALVVSKILRALRGEGSLSFAIDDEAREHGAIALMGTIGCIWGLRPDGSLWQFDADFEFAALAFAAGTDIFGANCRFATLCLAGTVCPGPKNPMLPMFCAACLGLGWVTG